MLTRCYNPKRQFYHLYGGKGVKVCDEWHCFDNFYEWAITNGYKEDSYASGRNKLTLDRIDNEKDYSPTNCRFATIDEQNYNRSNTKRYEYQGGFYTTKELAEMAKIPTKTMGVRLQTMSIEKAMTTSYEPAKCHPIEYPIGYISTRQIRAKYNITVKQLDRVVLLGKLNRKKYKNAWIYLETDIQQLASFYANTYKYEWDKYSKLKIK